jgi:hypothetical protein
MCNLPLKLKPILITPIFHYNPFHYNPLPSTKWNPCSNYVHPPLQSIPLQSYIQMYILVNILIFKQFVLR